MQFLLETEGVTNSLSVFWRNSIVPHFARLIYVDMFALPQTKVAGRIVVNHSLSDRDTVID